MTSTTEIVEALRDGMDAAVAQAREIGPDILGGFCERLVMCLSYKDEATRVTIQNIVGPIMDQMVETRGTPL